MIDEHQEVACRATPALHGVARHRARVVAAAALAAAAVVGVVSPAYADKVRDDQWHLSFLDIASAHEIGQGEGITVAVVDTGIDEDHLDLAGNVLEGMDVVDGGNANGWGDVDGHGTGMAGLVAAHGHGAGNADGALGIAPQAKILPLRIDTGQGVGAGDALALAVDEAVRRGADIISISVVSDARVYDPIQRALAAGVIVVASAGNRPNDEYIGDPAAYPGVVAVGAVGRDGLIAEVSTRGLGLGQISLTAPGVDIVSTSKDGKYRIGTGTSPSTAIVAGVAALVWSTYPDLSNVEVVEHLTATSVDKGSPGRDAEYGFGVVDPVNALTTRPVTTTTTTAAPGPTAPVTVAHDEGSAAERAAGRTASDDDGTSIGPVVWIGAVVLGTVMLGLAVARRRSRRSSTATPRTADWRPPPGPRPPPPPP